jgi:carbon-monoxide dehydrogenase iron sulfur subunit
MKSIFVNPERCVACRTCEIACAVSRSSLTKELPAAIYEEILPLPRVRVEPAAPDRGFPVQCRHCEDAPCLDACPAGALYRHENGLVLLHDTRCIGCWMCVMVCPFGAPRPFRHFRKMLKCDQCHDMETVACVESCPTEALMLLDPQDLAAGRPGAAVPRATLVGLTFAAPVDRRESE